LFLDARRRPSITARYLSVRIAAMDPRPHDAEDFAGLLARQVPRHGDRPFLTWYGGSGGRVELSWRTFANWVAKTANLLVEELGVGAGDRVATLLGVHWQAPVVLVACWLAGAEVVPAGPGVPRERVAGTGCRAVFAREDLLAEARELLGGEDLTAGAARPALLAVTADPLGRAAGDLGDALPFARVVPSMPDHFDPEDQRQGDRPALLAAGQGDRGRSQAELLAAAAELRGRLGLSDADRLYSGLGLDTLEGVTAGLALPLTAGGGVVLAADSGPEVLWRRLAAERVALALLRPEQAGALQAETPPADLDLSRLRGVRTPPEW
jgi:uncharacterized protein (TIGR03089 family)